MAELEILALKNQQPVKGPPPSMENLRTGYVSPSELKLKAQRVLNQKVEEGAET